MDGRTKSFYGAWAVVIVAWVIVAAAFAAIFLLAMSLGGCSQVTMSPAYRQNLEMTNVLVAELDARCAAGDPNACRDGLAESAEYLAGLVDAVNGVDTKGGQIE